VIRSRRSALARIATVVAATAASSLSGRPAAAAPVAIELRTSDHWTVYARSYPGRVKTAPIVLLFHQAGSSKGEYRDIAPKLQAMGYNALAIDQRAGGDLFDTNETVTKNPGKSVPESADGYVAALSDLRAAYLWARASYPGSRVILWGSSYSSDLVFLLAARDPAAIAAILSFSPDPSYLGDPKLVLSAASHVRVPVLIVSAPGEENGGKSILEALPSTRKSQYVAPKGVHGSSTLIDSRNPAGAAANWSIVAKFLKRAAPASSFRPITIS
jgi:dienelactone hydrolase